MLHPFAVAAAEAEVGTFSAELWELFPLLGGGNLTCQEKRLQRVLQDVSDVVFIQAIEVAGIHTAVCLHHQLGLTVTVNAAGRGHSVGHEIDYIVKELDAPVFALPKICQP